MISSFSYNPCSNCGNQNDLSEQESVFNQQDTRALDRILGDWDCVDLLCNKCGHSWTLILTNESDTQEDVEEVGKIGTERGPRFWEEGE